MAVKPAELSHYESSTSSGGGGAAVEVVGRGR